jgi:Domain of unknown function (DUF1707)
VSYGTPWGYRRGSQANPDMRVSHAERTEVADRLSKHYGDGRLDEDEFNERLDRAMKAKTQADLHGLFADLPDRPDQPGPAKEVRPMPHRRSLFPRILLFVLVIIAASALWHAVTPPFFFLGGLYVPWLLIAVIAFFVWRSRARGRRP